MVSQKRSGYGFSGYQVPWVPRASRSPRGRGSCKKKLEDDRIFAFEVLASLAGELLQERETSASISDLSAKNQHSVAQSAVKCETRDQEHKIKLEPGDYEEMRADVFHSPGRHQSHVLNEFSHANDGFSLKTSSMVDADLPESVCFSDKPAVDCMQNASGSSPCKVAGGFPCSGIFSEGNAHREIETKPAVLLPVTQTRPEKGSSKEMGRAILAPVHLDNNAKASWFSDHITSGPSPRCQEKLLASRDDDENSSGWSQPSTITKTYTPTPDIGNQRAGRSPASSCLRGTPSSKEGGSSNTDGRRKPVYCTWKTCQPRQRSQRISPFKRRKSLEQNTESSSDRGSMYNCHNKGKKSENSSPCAAASQAGGASSSVAGQQAPSQSRDCTVKLSIKSFRVPELFVEIPATATVGSLKRAVMEAVTAVLGDGTHVGILLQGKKVGDDDKTLLQTGISQGDKLRTLGFMLEPRQAQPASLCPKDPSVFLHGSTTQRLTSFSSTSTTDPRASKIFPDPPVTNLSKGVQKSHDTAPLNAEVSTGKTKRESRALIAVPAASLEPLAMVPFHQKSRHPEFVKRRIRRPFSVSEVEALVQAVENLGTGRWRDVKICAFDGAKHRTYVDLKDKWKTLVHTAKISPQQRRGEPVPQELLDRVLAAHAYWSQHQAKQQQVKV